MTWWQRVGTSWPRLARLLSRAVDACPGTCGSSVGSISSPELFEWPSDLSAEGCRRDVAANGSCWCGKYASYEELDADLEHPLAIRGRWHDRVITFKAKGGGP